MPLTRDARASALAGRTADRLDARLQRNVTPPVALALSGGGDSMALLALVSDWARSAGRKLVAITVDHGLNAASAEWSRFCAGAARAVGADWIERRWMGDKPATGLPAAARRARHALIADAARGAGARVVLFAHTADDIAESDWMRAQGARLGTLREWSPSPVWPEGRGLMLLRPLLGERREVLRDLLRAERLDWIEDPGNAGFARGEARRVLAALSAMEPINDQAASQSGARGEGAFPNSAKAVLRPPPQRTGRPIALSLGEGFEGAGHLAATVLCAAGHDRLPRAERLIALEARLAHGVPFVATLSGARVEACDDRVLVTRETGELRRRPAPTFNLLAGQPTVWDGRYEITTDADGWSIVPALGLLARLPDVDRAVVMRSPAAVRGALPVLIRDGMDAPVLAWRHAQVRSLAPRRLSLALGETTQESDLDRTIHGEIAPPDLF